MNRIDAAATAPGGGGAPFFTHRYPRMLSPISHAMTMGISHRRRPGRRRGGGGRRGGLGRPGEAPEVHERHIVAPQPAVAEDAERVRAERDAHADGDHVTLSQLAIVSSVPGLVDWVPASRACQYCAYISTPAVAPPAMISLRCRLSK